MIKPSWQPSLRPVCLDDEARPNADVPEGAIPIPQEFRIISQHSQQSGSFGSQSSIGSRPEWEPTALATRLNNLREQLSRAESKMQADLEVQSEQKTPTSEQPASTSISTHPSDPTGLGNAGPEKAVAAHPAQVTVVKPSGPRLIQGQRVSTRQSRRPSVVSILALLAIAFDIISMLCHVVILQRVVDVDVDGLKLAHAALGTASACLAALATLGLMLKIKMARCAKRDAPEKLMAGVLEFAVAACIMTGEKWSEITSAATSEQRAALRCVQSLVQDMLEPVQRPEARDQAVELARAFLAGAYFDNEFGCNPEEGEGVEDEGTVSSTRGRFSTNTKYPVASPENFSSGRNSSDSSSGHSSRAQWPQGEPFATPPRSSGQRLDGQAKAGHKGSPFPFASSDVGSASGAGNERPNGPEVVGPGFAGKFFDQVVGISLASTSTSPSKAALASVPLPAGTPVVAGDFTSDRSSRSASHEKPILRTSLSNVSSKDRGLQLKRTVTFSEDVEGMSPSSGSKPQSATESPVDQAKTPPALLAKPSCSRSNSRSSDVPSAGAELVLSKPQRSVSSLSDLSATSFRDYNLKHASDNARDGTGAKPTIKPSLIEFLQSGALARLLGIAGCGMPSLGGNLTNGVESEDPIRMASTKAVVNMQLPNRAFARPMTVPEEISDGHGTLRTLRSYNSMCDDLVTDDNDRDSESQEVFAEVVDSSGETVRIGFKSSCIKTQNAYQKRLLRQQKSLLRAYSMELNEAKQELETQTDVVKEERSLLRGFRKIVTREFDEQVQIAQQDKVEVIVIEKRSKHRADLVELCRILEYPCTDFSDLAAGLASMDQGSLAVTSTASRNSLGTSSRRPTLSEGKARIVLLGGTFLSRVPKAWPDKNCFVSLVTEAEEFENVGRQLLAGGEDEVREKLASRGISEYLLYPLSMETIEGVVRQALHGLFGEEYLLIRQIGRGSFGVVYQSKRIRDAEVFAMKEINMKRLQAKAKNDVKKETEALAHYSWPTVIYMVDSWVAAGGQLLYVLMPLMSGGSLADRVEECVHEDGQVEADAVEDWLAQTIHGLSYLHWQGVLHTDVKPGNLLLGEKNRLRIGDLGSIAFLPGPGPHPCRRNCVEAAITTAKYAPPEVLSDNKYYPASDLWAVGASFYEVLTLKSLVPEERTSAGEIRRFSSEFHPSEADTNGENLAERICSGWEVVKKTACTSEVQTVVAEMAQQVANLLRHDPLERPMAASLVASDRCRARLRRVLDVDLEDVDTEAHFEELDTLLSESAAAEDVPLTQLSPSGQSDAESAQPARLATDGIAAPELALFANRSKTRCKTSP